MACGRGTVRGPAEASYPGPLFGPTIEGLPVAVQSAYSEARNCLSVNAHTAAEMVCRKILMHIAADKGADEGKSFAYYIDFLQAQGYITPPMKDWVVLIKEHGNKANHRLDAPDKEQAEGTLQFTAQLLRSVYEMGHIAGRFAKPRQQSPSAP